MKRAGNLWPELVSWDNLDLAAQRARRGKRFKPGVLEFEHRREAELIRLQAELLDGTYRPGPYHTFVIHEPKRRLISAASFRDRVVHHALVQVLEPVFEPTLLPCAFANRTGYGTHGALRRFTRLLRGHAWVLRGDVRQFFPSIDHAILKEQVRRRVKCARTLALLDHILDGSNEQEPVVPVYLPGDDLVSMSERRRGLPIGNLTSQFLANVYLTPLDHLFTCDLRLSACVRYVDDFAVFADSREVLAEAQVRASQTLSALRLRPHPAKTQIYRTSRGSSFVGFHVLPDRVRVRGENLRRARRRFRTLAEEYRLGTRDWPQVQPRLRSWIAHLEHGDTWKLRDQIFSALTFVRG